MNVILLLGCLVGHLRQLLLDAKLMRLMWIKQVWLLPLQVVLFQPLVWLLVQEQV